MAKKYLAGIDLTKTELQNARIHQLATAPGSPVTGQIYYNTTDNKSYYWNNTSWIDMTGGAGSPNAGTLTLTSTAGATNTAVTVGTGTGFNANTSSNLTYDIDVGPALTNLASTMTGAGTGFLKKNGADAYTLDTATYLTGNQTITLSGDATGSGATAITVAISAGTVTGKALTGYASGSNTALAATDTILAAFGKVQGQLDAKMGTTTSSAVSITNATASSNTTTGALVVTGGVGIGGNANVGGNLAVTGNLTINGTTTTVNSTTVTIDDPIFTLGGDTAPGADDNKDRGIEFRWHNGTVAKVGFFGFDDSTGKLTFIPDATNTSEVFSGTIGEIDATIAGANVTGTVTNSSQLGGTAAASYALKADTHFIGTTSIALNRASAAQALTGITSIDGSAASWTTGRTITLTGDATGTSGTFNGSANLSFATTISDATVTGKVLTGYTAGSNTALAATDTILAAMGKVQGQLNAKPTKYSTAIAGTAVSEVITHNLGTRDVIVQLYNASTPWEQVECDVEATSTNTVTLRFAVAPSAGQYRVVVI